MKLPHPALAGALMGGGMGLYHGRSKERKQLAKEILLGSLGGAVAGQGALYAGKALKKGTDAIASRAELLATRAAENAGTGFQEGSRGAIWNLFKFKKKSKGLAKKSSAEMFVAALDELNLIKEAKKLTAQARDHISEGNFALSNRRYPIHDVSHARAALSMVAKHGTSGEQAQVRAAVARKYPGMGKQKEASEGPLNSDQRKAAVHNIARVGLGAAAGGGLAWGAYKLTKKYLLKNPDSISSVRRILPYVGAGAGLALMLAKARRDQLNDEAIEAAGKPKSASLQDAVNSYQGMQYKNQETLKGGALGAVAGLGTAGLLSYVAKKPSIPKLMLAGTVIGGLAKRHKAKKLEEQMSAQ